MRSVTHSMGASLDGYIVGPDGKFDWAPPDAEVFGFRIDEIRAVRGPGQWPAGLRGPGGGDRAGAGRAELDVPLWRAVSTWLEASWPFAGVTCDDRQTASSISSPHCCP